MTTPWLRQVPPKLKSRYQKTYQVAVAKHLVAGVIMGLDVLRPLCQTGERRWLTRDPVVGQSEADCMLIEGIVQVSTSP